MLWKVGYDMGSHPQGCPLALVIGGWSLVMMLDAHSCHVSWLYQVWLDQATSCGSFAFYADKVDGLDP
jgi:hypothetical protein